MKDVVVYLECQDCGVRVYGPLNLEERQKVANDPYNYVVYCRVCRRVGKWR